MNESNQHTLGLIQFNLDSQAWTTEKGEIKAGDLSNIKEQNPNNSVALNALPTPFARFFVVKEAFRRVLAELKNPKYLAGEAYKRLVSDTLDIFEIIYNQTYHQSRWGENRKLLVREWAFDTDLNVLKDKVPILGFAVENYFPYDLKGCDKKLFFVILREGGRDYLLGTSSPFTGFTTPPDLDKKIDAKTGNISFLGSRYEHMSPIVRKSGGHYFEDIRMFGERSADFKNYLFQLLNNSETGPEMNELRDYVRDFIDHDKEISWEWRPQTKPLLSDNSNEVTINGLPIEVDAGINTVNFFSDTLVRLPFALSRDFYQSMNYISEPPKDHDYLIPLSQDALQILGDDFKFQVKEMNSKVVVTLVYNGQKFEKEYFAGNGPSNRGRIIDLQRQNINLNIAVFPNILSPIVEENNYFKIMSVLHDSTENFQKVKIDDLKITFYKRNSKGKFEDIGEVDRDNNTAEYGLYPAVVRSRQNEQEEVSSGSIFYEVFKTEFEAMHLSLRSHDGECEGILIPKWNRVQKSNDIYSYAIDLGTTNTYISCKKEYTDNSEPQQLVMNNPQVGLLHNSEKSAQHSILSIIENGMNPNILKNFRTEFMPAMIDGKINHFPIRTALCKKRGDNSEPNLFDNCNIPFFYEKTRGMGNQEILTDIKWENKNENSLREYIRELLLIIRSDILQRGGNIAETKLIWFRPLSFKSSIRDLYKSIWEKEAKSILGIYPQNIACVSESEAPYYYYQEKNKFNAISAVSLVDIGGGSTDFVYFSEGNPKIANSVHFGCDVLWGNGFSKMKNDRSENGIYNAFSNTIHFGSYDDELEKLNLQMRANKEVTTKDIINFWLNNDNLCDFKKQLKTKYKPLFLYHFASIVYYMAKMYKTKGLKCPRSVLFCGNGSRYIDELISTNPKVIEELVTTIFQEIYGQIEKVQILLPQERKECTCYGGLNRPINAFTPSEFIFQGVDNTEYKNVKELNDNFTNIAPLLLKTIQDFNTLYKKLLGILIANNEVENLKHIDTIYSAISENVKDSLDKNFKMQVVNSFHEEEVYHDSIFFLPIIDNILNLTKI